MKIEFSHKKVLVAPLDWGLGHASRCVPVIDALLKNENEVSIAAEGAIKILLENEFPHLQFVKLFNYNITYATNAKWLWWHILKQLPKIFSAIKKENEWLQNFVEQQKIDVVISDNRYGLFSKKCNCILITHQLTLQMPDGWRFLQPFTKKMLQRWIKKFDQCWIPDFENEQINLSGSLSHHQQLLPNTIFIEPLSRFEKLKHEAKIIESDILILLSGPEPQRTLLEQKILQQLFEIKNCTKKIIIIGGKCATNNSLQPMPSFVDYFPSANATQLCGMMMGAKKIICRSGYSTIMDLQAINRTAIFIPTPSQTEQEYLAKWMQQNEKGIWAAQNNFEIKNWL